MKNAIFLKTSLNLTSLMIKQIPAHEIIEMGIDWGFSPNKKSSIGFQELFLAVSDMQILFYDFEEIKDMSTLEQHLNIDGLLSYATPLDLKIENMVPLG